jgi:hypothetical protein
MAVSDLAGPGQGAHGPKRDWPALRRLYEQGALGYRRFGRLHSIPLTTLADRIRRERWVRNAVLVKKTAEEINARLDAKVKQRIESELAPWIEAEKAKFTRVGVHVASTGMSRVKRMFRRQPNPDPKSEAFISKAAETYHRVGRVALGMSDGTAPVMPLNLAILGNHTAVQIVRQGPESDSQDS